MLRPAIQVRNAVMRNVRRALMANALGQAQGTRLGKSQGAQTSVACTEMLSGIPVISRLVLLSIKQAK
jgi:hypothetical protein